MDKARLKAFMEAYVERVTGAATLGVIGVADRLGLFDALAESGPATPRQLASAISSDERYTLEMLSALAAARVVDFDDDTNRFDLPTEAAICLTDSSSPYYLAGWAQAVPAILAHVPGVAAAARSGEGIAYAEFGEDVAEGIARMNGPAIEALLTAKWLPALPHLVGKLEAGARVADVGCGGGAAAITIARRFPRSHVIGYDPHAGSLAAARVAAAGIDNVQFEAVAAQAIPLEPPFDIITSFDAIHDMGDPLGALVRIRRALEPDGTYLMVEPAAEDGLAANLDPRGALFYAISALHCVPVSRAEAGPGLGTAWGPRQAEELATEAGFSSFARAPIDNPTNAFYELKP